MRVAEVHHEGHGLAPGGPLRALQAHGAVQVVRHQVQCHAGPSCVAHEVDPLQIVLLAPLLLAFKQLLHGLRSYVFYKGDRCHALFSSIYMK